MRTLTMCLLALLVVSVGADAQDFVLSVAGSGKSGTDLVFTVTPQKPVLVNKISFLGISPLQGQTQFEFWTMDLGWPILASGMAGSLPKGPTTRKFRVPDLPPGLRMTWFAQSLVVQPKGGGYQIEKTNVVKFVISG